MSGLAGWFTRRERRGAVAGALVASILLPLALAACEGSEAMYPTPARRRSEGAPRYGYGETRMGEPSVFGDGGIFSRTSRGSQEGGGSGIGVNNFLWRAALDSLAFMPLASADPFGGVIVTDWHALPEAPNERFKVNLFILGRELRADGLRAALFRQRRDPNGSWTDVPVDEGSTARLEDAILTRARELRLAQR
jgi:hypothetical protein